MVNRLYLYSLFLVLSTTQSALQYITTHPSIHTHSYTDDRSYHTGYQPAHQEETNHSYTFIHWWCSNGRNLGLSVLPKDTSTCGLEEPGIAPPIFQLVDDLLYVLSHSCPDSVSSEWVVAATRDLHIECHVRMIETTIHIVWITQLESTLGQTYRLLP